MVKNGSETLSGSLAPHFLLGNVGMDTHGNRSLAQESQTRVAHFGDCLPSCKHGLLENAPSMHDVFPAIILINLHLVRGFLSQPCLMTPERSEGKLRTHSPINPHVCVVKSQYSIISG